MIQKYAAKLNANTSLTELDPHYIYNSISRGRDDYTMAIPGSVKVNTDLITVNLYYILIGVYGAKYIISGGSRVSNTFLISLYLSDNSIGDKNGGKAISEALKVPNTFLRILNLVHNLIGTKVIAEALEVNPVLKFFCTAGSVSNICFIG